MFGLGYGHGVVICLSEGAVSGMAADIYFAYMRRSVHLQGEVGLPRLASLSKTCQVYCIEPADPTPLINSLRSSQ